MHSLKWQQYSSVEQFALLEQQGQVQRQVLSAVCNGIGKLNVCVFVRQSGKTSVVQASDSVH